MIMEKTTNSQPTASYIRSQNLHAFGWNMFKEHLVKIKVMESTKDEVPDDWNQAFLKACRGNLD